MTDEDMPINDKGTSTIESGMRKENSLEISWIKNEFDIAKRH
jgi:hypothetical protein